jgi:hypothetical protein
MISISVDVPACVKQETRNVKWGKYSTIQETAVIEIFYKSFCSTRKAVLPYSLRILEDKCPFFH